MLPDVVAKALELSRLDPCRDICVLVALEVTVIEVDIALATRYL